MDAGKRLPVVQAGGLPEAEPLFDRVAIVGLGLMGGSLAMAVRQAWPRALVIGVDDNDVLETAIRLGAVDVGADDPVVAAEADLVVLAVPVAEIIRLLESLPDLLDGDAVVTDLGGSKRAVVEAARRLPPRLTFVGGHPLAGAPRQGIDTARADLYVGRPWVLTPGRPAPDAVERLGRFVKGVGSEPVIMTPAEHDRLLAYISHVPQLVASALMEVVGEGAGEPGLSLSGTSLLDATRLAASPGDAWKDVYTTNADEVRPALDRLIATLSRLRDGLDSGGVVEDLFESARAWRARLASVRQTGR